MGVAAVVYGCLVAFVFFYQARMLYLPDIAGQGLVATPQAIGVQFEDVRLTTSDGVSIHGWFVPAEHTRRVVLHCHGNGGNISHRLELLQILRSLELSVFLFDYRGYGLSDGRPNE